MRTGPIGSPVEATPRATPSPRSISAARTHRASATLTTASEDGPTDSRQNSSPPSRAASAPGSIAPHTDSTEPKRSSRRSPTAWPRESLTRFRPFRSQTTRLTTVPDSRCRSTASSSPMSTARRFASPVSGSVNASLRTSSSSSVWAIPAATTDVITVAKSASGRPKTGSPAGRAT